MAFIYADMPCSLCGSAIEEGDEFVACAHFITEESDSLWRYSGSSMHRRCFDAWERREEFTRRYHEAMAAIRPGAGHSGGPESGTLVMPADEAFDGPRPESACPACGKPLYVSERVECRRCHWLRFPGDRSRWGKAGACPRCGFAYRWDGSHCSHCGLGANDDPAARPPT